MRDDERRAAEHGAVPRLEEDSAAAAAGQAEEGVQGVLNPHRLAVIHWAWI